MSAKARYYLNLEQPSDAVQVCYVWIDGTGVNLRCKTRTVDMEPYSIKDLLDWTFCGSATGHATGNLAEYYLRPVALYRDPFRGGQNKLVLCETFNTEMQPSSTNHRSLMTSNHSRVKGEELLFGFEQEYTLIDVTTGRPMNWPSSGGYPAPQGPYYCGVGAGTTNGREIMESHYRACLYAGIRICGENAEVMPSQWEYQLGPSHALQVADDLWMSRFILHRVAEDFNVRVTFDPKPVKGDWNGTGLHCNVSNSSTRSPYDGLKAINGFIDKLRLRHKEHILKYDPNNGLDNQRRLTGLHETSNIDQFTTGVGDRGASVRVPKLVSDARCGYFEDRRPSSNADPYVVINQLITTMYDLY